MNCACVLTEVYPNNYRIFSERAIIYLAMEKYQPALADLDAVLSLKPDFNAVCTLTHIFDVLLLDCMIADFLN